MDATAPPYDLPPSYEEVIRGISRISETSGGLSIVDFLPEEEKIRFPTLVERANEWLRQHPTWEAKTCESVEFKCKQGMPNVDHMTFLEYNTRTRYVRALRLWIIPRNTSSRSPQQIGYLNFVPECLSQSLFNTKFEHLDSLISKINNHLSAHPLEGKILTIETQPMKFSTSDKAVDPDKTYFRDFGFSVFVLRIFYEIGGPQYETVYIQDFIPNREPSGCCEFPKYSSIQQTIADARNWCSRMRNLRICNIQTIQMKLQHGFQGEFDSSKMAVREFRGEDSVTIYIKVLRIACVESKANPSPLPLNAPMTCKIFLPVQLTNYQLFKPPEFENTQQTLSRIAEWCRVHNVKIISAETTALRMYPYSRKKEGPESSCVVNKGGTAEYFIYIISLYLEGDYPDPPIMMCPISHYGWRSHPVTSADNIPNTSDCTLL